MNQIIPTSEPFFFPGSNFGVLLVHGFTGTPKEMRWMGEYLHLNLGYTVLGIRLSGHATRPEDMIRSTYQDWLVSVEDGFMLLRDCVDKIILMGLSMGGILTLTTAAYLPVHGVVAMSTPYNLPDDPRLRHIEWYSKLTSYMPKSSEAPGASWFDKESFKDHISYPENPVHAIGELNKLIEEMHLALPKITVPVLLIHSRDDHYVDINSMPLLFEHLKTEQKEMLWLEGSGHVMTRDAKRSEVFEAAANFSRKIVF